jgi:hypothetical protein
VEFDLPYLPEDARALYPGADPELLRDCGVLMQAMVAAWRWDRHDQHPLGLDMGREFVELVRAGWVGSRRGPSVNTGDLSQSAVGDVSCRGRNSSQ